MRHAEGRLKAELQTIIGCFLAVSAVCACVARPVAAQGTTAAQAEPLTLTTENTVILDRSVYAGRFLQFYLIKFFVGEKEAAPYAVNEKSDRAGSRHFPLIAEDGKKPIPDGRNVIAVGDTRFLPPEERERLASNPGAILLRRVGKAVVVAGSPFNDGWGAPVKAMATFLDRVAGIRFYAPGDLWVSRPQRGSMTVATLDFFQPQLFVTSNLSAYIERNAEWLRMNPNANRMTLIANHNLANMFPPQKYGKTHPEIYEMRGGKRVVPAYLDGGAAWNPCLSAEALPELAMSHVRGVMQKKLPPRSVSFGVMDCAFDCECPACQESVKRHNGSYSHLYYTFMNKVARMCQQEFPELYLTTLGYSNVRTPPVGMKVAPNIAIKVVTKTYRLVEPAWAQAEKARIKAFSDLGGKWWIHDWCFSGVSPRSYLRQYGAFLQWGHQNGMLGAYIEWTPGESWYLDGAKYWILMQLMSDPYQDVDLLWKRHCEDMYGTASETMYRFFAHFADRYVYAPNHIGLDDLPRQEPAMHTAEDLAYQRSLLEKAAGLTKDDSLAQQRLACVMRYFRAHELFAQATAEPHRLDFTFKGAALEGFTERDTLLDSKHKTSGRLLRVG
ncbi:MAG: DUF4838 domain-containing protein, partial [Planctomycetes bacterium]|nr:DUF4838 domain-containing protein [Planctomycetota bacterium]